MHACPRTSGRGAQLPLPQLSANEHGMGRELFATFRAAAGDAESGALSCFA